MKKAIHIFLAAILAVSVDGHVVKTNVFYDASATVNLGLEFRTGGRTSVDLPFNYNGFEFGGNKKWKHFLAQPALRIWTHEAFSGHFFGIHSHWAYYNIGRLPINDYTRAHHFEGTLYGGGVSWGYRWNFGRGGRRHARATYTQVGYGDISSTGKNQKRTRPYEARTAGWSMEVELGAGYAYLDYDIYNCGKCGDFVKHETKNYFGPTKVAVNLIYAFGGYSGNPQGVLTRRERVLEGVRPVGGGSELRGSQGEPQPSIHPFTPTFVAPDPEGYKDRTDSIRADLEFVFDVAQLEPMYRNNAAELRKLNSSIGDIRRSRHTTITSIDIIGFASPEGSEGYNIPLSARRAESVRDYLETVTGLPAELFSARGEGEREDGLRAMVEVDYTVEPFTMDEVRRSIYTRPHFGKA